MRGGEDQEQESQETGKETAISISAIHRERCLIRRWNWKTYMACVCSFLVSLAGGAVLVYWELKHHPTNTQLWMVPVGLILFCTPAFIWVSAIFSCLCYPREGDCCGRALQLRGSARESNPIGL